MMTMVGDPIPVLRPYPAAANHWDPLIDDNTHSPYAGSCRAFLDSLSALHRYLPSNDQSPAEEEFDGDEEGSLVLDAFACDNFRMYEFKVRRCARGRSHDWTECPYAHPGEKARRRDPRRFHYSGAACPDFRKGVGCKKGDACEYAHGVFECWLHPTRYRTQPCKDGSGCRRRVCFFAHTPDQLRVLPHGGGFGFGFGSGDHSYISSPPLSTPSDSPPMSPSSPQVVSELVATMRGLQLARTRSVVSPRGMQTGSMFGPPLGVSPVQTGFSNLPGMWGMGSRVEEPAMERVESGRDIRAQMYAKLCRENSIGREPVEPDVGWISELVK